MSVCSFKAGDVVWVPSTSPQGRQQLWPAKFLKQTNRADICMVSLYGTKPGEMDEQFLVDTDGIVAFDKHRIGNSWPELMKVYQIALKDAGKNNQLKVEEISFKSSGEFCDYIETTLLAQLMDINNGGQAQTLQIPKFFKGDLPLSNPDLKLYFDRMIPQMIAYLLESQTGKSNLKTFLEESKNKIMVQISKKLANFQVDFEGCN